MPRRSSNRFYGRERSPVISPINSEDQQSSSSTTTIEDCPVSGQSQGATENHGITERQISSLDNAEGQSSSTEGQTTDSNGQGADRSGMLLKQFTKFIATLFVSCRYAEKLAD